MCNLDALGDEYHYLKAYYYIRPIYVKLEEIFYSSNNTVLLKLAKLSTLISIIFLILYVYVYFIIIIIAIIF